MKYIYTFLFLILTITEIHAARWIDGFINHQFSCDLFDKDGNQFKIGKKLKGKVIEATVEMTNQGFSGSTYMKYEDGDYAHIKNMTIKKRGIFIFTLADENVLKCTEIKVNENATLEI